MSALKTILLPRISDKKDMGRSTLLKNNNKYDYGHSTGYEA